MANSDVENSSSKGPTLHHLSSSQSLRVLWALEELAANGQPYNLKTYLRENARAPAELKSVFPLGRSPILVVDAVPESSSSDQQEQEQEQKQQTVVTESRLILQYIADNYSNGVWTPSNAEDKRRDQFWQEFATATLASRQNFVMMFDIVPQLTPWVVRPLASALFGPLAGMFKKDLPANFELMEGALSEERPWFAGAKLGLADFVMSFPMDMAEQRRYIDASLYPKIADWHKRVHERPAYKRALEKGGPYNLATFV